MKNTTSYLTNDMKKRSKANFIHPIDQNLQLSVSCLAATKASVLPPTKEINFLTKFV